MRARVLAELLLASAVCLEAQDGGGGRFAGRDRGIVRMGYARGAASCREMRPGSNIPGSMSTRAVLRTGGLPNNSGRDPKLRRAGAAVTAWPATSCRRLRTLHAPIARLAPSAPWSIGPGPTVREARATWWLPGHSRRRSCIRPLQLNGARVRSCFIDGDLRPWVGARCRHLTRMARKAPPSAALASQQLDVARAVARTPRPKRATAVDADRTRMVRSGGREIRTDPSRELPGGLPPTQDPRTNGSP